MPEVRSALAAALADRYRMERELGQGGMATVYLAHDLRHDRQVALKVLRPELALTLGPERFLREIVTTAGLRHPHILPLYDSGSVAGSSGTGPFLYYVMPYVEGESLRDRLTRERQLPLDEALRITREVADGLGYAHTRGLIHRDIKPENILLEGGHAILADFGIARALSAAGAERLTQTGMSVGTPLYMSPEQAAGDRDLDGRSDLYSLGCVLYEMLGGQPPFTGPNGESIVRQHLIAEPPPITNLRAGVPREIEGVLMRALAKSPADRYGTAADLVDALDPGTGFRGAASRTREGLHRNRNRIVAGIALIGAIATFLLWPRPEAPLVVGQTSRVTLDPGLEVDPALSPDGQLLAYAAGPVNRMQIYVRRLSGGRAIALTSDTGVNHRRPRWAPDGDRLAFQAGNSLTASGSISVVPALGGAARILVAGSDGTSVGDVAWSPDGRQVAYVQAMGATFPDAIYLRGADGGEPRLLTRAFEPHSLAWSPDGRRLAYVSGNSEFVFGTSSFGNLAPSSIWVVAIEAGKPVRVTNAEELNVSPVWLPDARHLLWVSARGGGRDVYRVRLGRTGAPAGPPERLTTGLEAHGISLSRDGTRLAYAQSATYGNIYEIPFPKTPPATTSNASALTRGSQKIEGVALSRDGTSLAFDSNQEGVQHIYRMPVTGGDPIQVTNDSSDDFFPSWSPDGRRIAFHSWRQGSRDLFTVSADGGDRRAATHGPPQDRGPDWSPDGRQLAFNREVGAQRDIWLLTLDDNPDSVRRLTHHGADPGGVAWSSAGDWIAYTRRGAVWVVSPDGTEERGLVDSTAGAVAGTAPKWSLDGRTLYYAAQNVSGAGLWAVPATGGQPRLVVQFTDPGHQPTHWEFAVGKTAYFVELGTRESDIWVAVLRGP
jgi:Tol biopolymer transport system component